MRKLLIWNVLKSIGVIKNSAEFDDGVFVLDFRISEILDLGVKADY